MASPTIDGHDAMLTENNNEHEGFAPLLEEDEGQSSTDNCATLEQEMNENTNTDKCDVPKKDKSNKRKRPPRKKKLCTIEGCTKQSARAGRCQRHGAKPKGCSYEGCTNQALKGGACWSHGAAYNKAKTCSHEGCTNQALRGGVCQRHGAKVCVMQHICHR